MHPPATNGQKNPIDFGPEANTAPVKSPVPANLGQLVIIHFYRDEVTPIGGFFDSLVSSYEDVLFLASARTFNEEATEALNIRSFPTFIAGPKIVFSK